MLKSYVVYTLCENHKNEMLKICENFKSFRLFAPNLSTLSTKQCLLTIFVTKTKIDEKKTLEFSQK